MGLTGIDLLQTLAVLFLGAWCWSQERRLGDSQPTRHLRLLRGGQERTFTITPTYRPKDAQ